MLAETEQAELSQLRAENSALRQERAEVVRMIGRFANYSHVLQVLASERHRALGDTNGWGDLDMVLSARGQLLTVGDFRLLAELHARLSASGEHGTTAGPCVVRPVPRGTN